MKGNLLEIPVIGGKNTAFQRVDVPINQPSENRVLKSRSRNPGWEVSAWLWAVPDASATRCAMGNRRKQHFNSAKYKQLEA